MYPQVEDADVAQFIGIVLSELDAPLAHGFIREDDSPGEKPLFDLAIAQAKAAISPHRMANDLGWEWEPVMRVWVGRRDTHTPSMAHPAGADKPLNKLTMPGILLRGSCASFNGTGCEFRTLAYAIVVFGET
jgi:hypothetical protein